MLHGRDGGRLSPPGGLRRLQPVAGAGGRGRPGRGCARKPGAGAHVRPSPSVDAASAAAAGSGGAGAPPACGGTQPGSGAGWVVRPGRDPLPLNARWTAGRTPPLCRARAEDLPQRWDMS